MAEKLSVKKLHVGYKLEAYPKRSLVVSAQDLRDLYDWCLLHMREIEAEAARESEIEKKLPN